MTRPPSKFARIAGAAASAAVAVTVAVALMGTPRADEMLPDARARQSVKASKAAAKSAKAQIAPKRQKPAKVSDAKRADLARAKSAGASRVAAPSSAGTPDSTPAPIHTDPRVDRLLEGARKAWESIGQPGTNATGEPAGATSPTTQVLIPDLAPLLTTFRRPAEAREPGKVTAVSQLGARLFSEKKLSADHKLSCATCHDPAKSFTDSRPRAAGRVTATAHHNTPSLWNAGFAGSFGWGGGASSLEALVKSEIEREGEMDGTLDAAVVWLGRDETYTAAFDRAFGRSNALANQTVAQALAAYVRTLISPPTRFDRWVDGDAGALTAHEVEGFGIFTGKGGCATCHGGWRFTDDATRSSVGRAIKTPSLREAAWSAPYMFDGRARTLEAAVTHATTKRGQRNLGATERTALSAFVRTLSSEQRLAPNIQGR